MYQLGEKLTDEEVSEMLKEADTTDRGKLTWQGKHGKPYYIGLLRIHIPCRMWEVIFQKTMLHEGSKNSENNSHRVSKNTKTTNHGGSKCTYTETILHGEVRM